LQWQLLEQEWGTAGAAAVNASRSYGQDTLLSMPCWPRIIVQEACASSCAWMHYVALPPLLMVVLVYLHPFLLYLPLPPAIAAGHHAWLLQAAAA
jgi:hypothetical protein